MKIKTDKKVIAKSDTMLFLQSGNYESQFLFNKDFVLAFSVRSETRFNEYRKVFKPCLRFEVFVPGAGEVVQLSLRC